MDDGEWGSSVTDDGRAYWFSRVTGEVQYEPPPTNPFDAFTGSPARDLDLGATSPTATGSVHGGGGESEHSGGYREHSDRSAPLLPPQLDAETHTHDESVTAAGPPRAACASCAELRALLSDARVRADALGVRVAALNARLAERDRELAALRASRSPDSPEGAHAPPPPPPCGAALHLPLDASVRPGGATWHGAPLPTPAGGSSGRRSQPGTSRGGALTSDRALRDRSDLSDATWVVLHNLGLAGAMVFS